MEAVTIISAIVTIIILIITLRRRVRQRALSDWVAVATELEFEYLIGSRLLMHGRHEGVNCVVVVEPLRVSNRTEQFTHIKVVIPAALPEGLAVRREASLEWLGGNVSGVKRVPTGDVELDRRCQISGVAATTIRSLLSAPQVKEIALSVVSRGRYGIIAGDAVHILETGLISTPEVIFGHLQFATAAAHTLATAVTAVNLAEKYKDDPSPSGQ